METSSISHHIADPAFWVAAAIVTFFILAIKPLKKALIGALDGRSARIARELEEAAKLKREALAILASYKQKHAESTAEAVQIIETAKREAASIIEAAKKEMDSAIRKRMEAVMQRIEQAEKSAVNDIKVHAIDIAVSATRMILRDKVAKGEGGELVLQAAAELQRKLH